VIRQEERERTGRSGQTRVIRRRPVDRLVARAAGGTRPSVSLLVLAIFTGGVAQPAFGEPSADAPAIDQWIEQLGAAQFARREAASRSLTSAGRAAVGPLVEAIGQADLEVASRGVEIVRDLLDSADPDAALEAELALERLAEQGEEPLARVAAAALDFHFLGRSEEARLHLESLGAHVGHEPGFAGGGCEVHLGGDWRGDAADLRLLPRLRGVVRVSLHGVPVTAEAVGILGRLRDVKRLDLYNTGIDEASVQVLTARLPDALVDVRKGGRLGVSASGLAGPCQIANVQPGSAAARAGLSGGDVVVAIDGEPIHGFEALTHLVGQRGPGESLVLTIERPVPGDDAGRGSRRIECTVTLDAW
jgi:hypothetical protein